MHATMPSSLNTYIQEAGKLGRGQNPTDCIIFYSILDYKRALDFITEPFKKEIKRGSSENKKKLEAELMERRNELYDVLVYAENMTICRQVFLLKHFDDESAAAPCGVCDVCAVMENSFVIDMSFTMKKILLSLWTINRRQKLRKEASWATINNFVSLLMGDLQKCFMGSWVIKEWVFGTFKSWDEQTLYRLIVILLSNKLMFVNQVVDDKFNVNQNLIITAKGQRFVQSNEEVNRRN